MSGDAQKGTVSQFSKLFPQENSQDVSLFVVSYSTESKDVVAEFSCVFNHHSRNFFVEAPVSLNANCRTAVANLLQLGEELGAEKVFMVIDKDNKLFAESVRTFLYLGFELIDPRVQKQLTPSEAVVLLGYSFACEDF